MRTAFIILAGFLFWGVCLAIGRVVAHGDRGIMTLATVVFVVIWFVVATVNMWLGVSKAGYSFREELPIFLLIFLLPVIVAVVLVKWKFF
jgi:hypothetical protein